MADRQFLPRYGFPIGVVRLRVIAPQDDRSGRIREEDQYRLERGSLLALREYVPGSQLVAGGKLITSHGLLRHWTGANLDTALGIRGQYSKCANGHLFYSIAEPLESCSVCGAESARSSQDLLFPRHGFTGAAWDPPKWSTEAERVGSVETATMTFTQHGEERPSLFEEQLGGITGLSSRYREDGELLVYNEGEGKRGFAICTKCGYAESERPTARNTDQLPPNFANHAGLLQPSVWRRCWVSGETPVLRNQTLAAREVTDVVLLDFTRRAGQYAANESLMTTLGYALQRAGAALLEMDSRELGVMVVPAGEAGLGKGIVLYDNTPGGAGHVRELLAYGRTWLEEARDVLYVDSDHHAKCTSACIDCLLAFDAQSVAELLDRRLALNFLDSLLGEDNENSGGNPPPQPTGRSKTGTSGPLGQTDGGISPRTTEQRVQAARERLRARR